MIIKLIKEAALTDTSGFKYIENINTFDFYKKIDNDSKRFLIVHETTSLKNADHYNNTIHDITPNEIKSEPAFERNSDLIIILKIENLGDFNKHEKNILSIEEDPYYFKKYVLYYSEEEGKLLENKTLIDLTETINDRYLFKEYKKKPNFPSLYSICARFFIKLPFLEVPVKETKMQNIDVMIDESLIEKNLNTFNDHLEYLFKEKQNDHTEILKSFENEGLENE